MTTEQERQWKAYACMSRCLIKAAAIRQIPLTADEYRSRYEFMFSCPIDAYGGLVLSTFLEIARLIGLGHHMDLCHQYSRANENFNKHKQLTFVFSGISLNLGANNCINHTTVLTAIDDNSFSLWHPDGSGADFDLPPLQADQWVAKQCCAITIF